MTLHYAIIQQTNISFLNLEFVTCVQ